MVLKIGVIGPQDSVDKILDFSEEIKDSALMFPYVYKDKMSAVELTARCQEENDLILYSGEAPYQIVCQAGILRKPALFLPRNGSCLYKALWEMREAGLDIRSISTESLSEKEISETIGELGIDDFQKIYCMDVFHDFRIDFREVVKFHRDLFREGRVDAAFTGFSRVYNHLKEEGIPVFKVFPTKSLIRENLNRALMMGEMKIHKDAQVAVQIVKIRDTGGSSSEYEFMALRNTLEKVLIPYTRENLGSLFPMGRDEYMIFSNRGAIERVKSYLSFMEMVFEEHSDKTLLSTGVGFGYTVYDAEKNARTALDHATRLTYSCAYSIDEKGTVSGPLAGRDDKSLSYSLSSGKEERVQKIAKDTGLSPVYISKIRALTEKNNKRLLDASLVADYLNLSVRSARRILNVMSETGYAEKKYTESKATTGRPMQIYEMKI